MKNFYKTISRRLILSILILISCVFLTGLSIAPEEVPVPQAEPSVSAPSPPPETPQDGAVIDHPLPEDPILTKGPWASEHFLMSEYACDCAGYCDGFPAEPQPGLVSRIEALRQAVGAPVIITSGVRCEERNEEVGGVAWSFHKRGAAADLYSPGVPVGTLAALAKDCGLNVLPYYSSGYVHVEI